MNKAFRGPNGWYVAFEDETGTHYQPTDGGRYESKEAALAAEEADEGKWWCQYCLSVVDPVNVTYDETHDPRSGGCGGCVQIIEPNAQAHPMTATLQTLES